MCIWVDSRTRIGTYDYKVDGGAGCFEVVKSNDYKEFDLIVNGQDDCIIKNSDEVSTTPYTARYKDRGTEYTETPKNLHWTTVTDSLGNDLSDYCTVDETGLTVKASIKEYYSGRGDRPIRITATAGENYTFTGFKTVYLKFPETPKHTATFKLGDEVVAEITFEEGQEELAEPLLLEKPNYTWHWDAYDLKSAKSDIVVQGSYELVNPEEVISDVNGSASATYRDGVATVTLNAFTPSKNIKVTSEKTKPVDVVLVVDQSGSMTDSLGGSKTKQQALIECANSFAQMLSENAKTSKADHRMALVGFAYSNYNSGKYLNTGILTSGKTYDKLTNADYQGALLPINSGDSVNPAIVSGINAIKAEGATAADFGLKIAKNIFTQNPAGENRERIVVFITDGTPTSWGETPSLIRATAAEAISTAETIKNGQNAKIYSVGVHESADPSAAFTASNDGVQTNARGEFAGYDFNRFLSAVSSNYPNAGAMNSLGSGSNDGYYMAVNDTSKLGNIFTSILYSTVYEIKAFDKANLSYTLSKDFVMTIEQEMEMRKALKDEYGIDDSNILVVRKEDGTTNLTFQSISTKEETVGSVKGQVATVKFKVSAAKDAAGSCAVGEGEGEILFNDSTIGTLPDINVNVGERKQILAFTINGQPYTFVETALEEHTRGIDMASLIPQSDIARWIIDEDYDFTGNYAVFEAREISGGQYSVSWYLNGEEVRQTYKFGDPITPPATETKDDLEVIGWTPAVPETMPAYNLGFTAQYHKHMFK